MSSRKSQVIGQVFIYILAIIIFSGVLLYGYKTIKGFSNRASEVELIRLTTDMKTAVKKISSDYGTVIRKEILIPSTYNKVCFIDISYPADSSLQAIYPAVYNSWADKAQANMFLITEKKELLPNYIEGIAISAGSNYFCTDVSQGKIILRLEGKGDYVELSEWQ